MLIYNVVLVSAIAKLISCPYMYIHCIFDVSLGEGEFYVLLLCHLD